jgi:zinc protease
MIRRAMNATLWLFLLAAWVSIAASQGLRQQVFEASLSNGLKIILLENHKAPVVTFQVWYRVGARNEQYTKTGLSHVLEHMMFKGTKKVGPGEFARIVQENGGQDNAFTSSDYTAYFENLSSDRIDVALELESDRMRNLVLRDEDFQTERSVVIEERRLRTDDNPKAVLTEQLEAIAFQIHPYRWPVIGWMQDLTRLTLDDLKQHYQRFYHPGNAFLVVVGDFKREELLPKIEKYFGGIPKAALPDQVIPQEGPQLGERRVSLQKEAQLASVVMGYHVPNLSHPDAYVLEVVAALLSAGESSRLQVNLVRAKELALVAGADNDLVSKDPNLFTIAADALPGKDVAEVEKAINVEVERLQKEMVGERELEKVKNSLESGFIYSQDSFFAQAMLLAQHEIVSSWRAVDDYVPSVRKVTAEDVQRVARRYLVPQNRTVAVLVPIVTGKEAPQPAGPALPEKVLR